MDLRPFTQTEVPCLGDLQITQEGHVRLITATLCVMDDQGDGHERHSKHLFPCQSGRLVATGWLWSSAARIMLTCPSRARSTGNSC
jgi:hypothetical protein